MNAKKEKEKGVRHGEGKNGLQSCALKSSV